MSTVPFSFSVTFSIERFRGRAIEREIHDGGFDAFTRSDVCRFGRGSQLSATSSGGLGSRPSTDAVNFTGCSTNDGGMCTLHTPPHLAAHMRDCQRVVRLTQAIIDRRTLFGPIFSISFWSDGGALSPSYQLHRLTGVQRRRKPIAGNQGRACLLT